MELVKGKPFFCDAAEKIKQYPYLNKDIICDVLIVGGGITGAILNYYIGKERDTALLEKSRLSYGCSSCSTALLEYTLDDDADTLSSVLTPKQIAAVYRMGQSGIKNIDDFILKHGNACHYSKRDVIVYSNRKIDVPRMEKEYEFLVNNGFQCQLFTEENNPFNFKISRAILFKDAGAEANTYLLAKELFENSANQNAIFENTAVESYQKVGGKYKVTTNFGNTVTCNALIFATGFDFELFSKKPLCDSCLTYSVVTNPIKDWGWYGDALVQDVLDPYHYLRRLPDGRILLGGEDKSFRFGAVIKEDDCKKHYDKLMTHLKETFPEIAEKAKAEYSFCGAFGSTRNNLGYIGAIKKDLYLFLSMGANGIVNAFYAVNFILRSLNAEKQESLAKLFSPKRYPFEVTNVKNK